MNKHRLLVLAAYLLILLGAIMLYLGITGSLLPPAVTGVGFLVIAAAFLSMRSN